MPLLAQSTGIAVDESIVSEFNDFKLRGKYRYMILGLAADNKSITLLKTGEPSASYSEFLGELPADDCRYAVLKFDYDAGSDGTRSKIVFFMWYVLLSFAAFLSGNLSVARYPPEKFQPSSSVFCALHTNTISAIVLLRAATQPLHTNPCQDFKF